LISRHTDKDKDKDKDKERATEHKHKTQTFSPWPKQKQNRRGEERRRQRKGKQRMAEKEVFSQLSQSSTLPMVASAQAFTNSPSKSTLSASSAAVVETEEDLTKHEKDYMQLFSYLNERLVERLSFPFAYLSLS